MEAEQQDVTMPAVLLTCAVTFTAEAGQRLVVINGVCHGVYRDDVSREVWRGEVVEEEPAPPPPRRERMRPQTQDMARHRSPRPMTRSRLRIHQIPEDAALVRAVRQHGPIQVRRLLSDVLRQERGPTRDATGHRLRRLLRDGVLARHPDDADAGQPRLIVPKRENG